MTDKQKTAVKCAYADLVGVYQCAVRDGNGGIDNGHDWKAHKLTIIEMEEAFDFIDPVSLED